ncbi:MAG: hypothetical protein ACRDT8_09440 [Micromonosporaceae bacterium]
MDATQFVAYACDQVRVADVILTQHRELISVCSCGRPLPCSAAGSVVRRRRHFVEHLAQFDAPTLIGSAPVNRLMSGQIMPRRRNGLSERRPARRASMISQDPLMPSEIMFPTSPLRIPHSDEQPSGATRPFALRGAVQSASVEVKHRTPYTNRPQKTTYTNDSRVMTDSYATPDT